MRYNSPQLPFGGLLARWKKLRIRRAGAKNYGIGGVFAGRAVKNPALGIEWEIRTADGTESEREQALEN